MSSLSPPQRLFQWGNGKKRRTREKMGRLNNLGCAGDDDKGPVSPVRVCFPSRQLGQFVFYNNKDNIFSCGAFRKSARQLCSKTQTQINSTQQTLAANVCNNIQSVRHVP